ncbi:MAG TPA: efflux RND transporter periplasmic adaptor subunit [Pyrinomonadaceae bacterium]|jgi:HlyD family secretion protein|nr:efflux RND transporter periplasmic adaptor subunit [Pyrinomonadaceae bacterium]
MAVSRKKKIIIAVAAVAVLGMIVVVSILARGKDEPEVTVVKVEARPELKSTVTASGEVRPIRFVNLTSEVQGRIVEISVNPGDHVTTGQPLVRVDPTQLESSAEAQAATAQAAIGDVQNARTSVLSAENAVAQAQQSLAANEVALAQSRQSVNTAQTSVDRAQVDLSTAQRELKRTTDLIESGVASRSEYDAAQDRLKTAQVALKTSQAQLEAAKIAVEEAKARVNQQREAVKAAQNGVTQAQQSVHSSESRANAQQALLRGQSSQRYKATTLSPLTGVVVDIPARVGQFTLASTSTTSLMTIADMTTINVEVNVDETEIAQVEEGQPAKVKVDAMGEKELTGTVTQKNPLAVSRSDTTGAGLGNRVNVQEAKEFKVVIELKDIPNDVRDSLKPGMTATATVTTKTKQNVLAVPLQAIVEKTPTPTPTPGGPAGQQPAAVPVGEKPKEIKGVYVLDGKKVKFIPVETGITGESDIEIVSGLQPNMEVITGPSRVLRTLKEGDAVKKQAAAKPGETPKPGDSK